MSFSGCLAGLTATARALAVPSPVRGSSASPVAASSEAVPPPEAAGQEESEPVAAPEAATQEAATPAAEPRVPAAAGAAPAAAAEQTPSPSARRQVQENTPPKTDQKRRRLVSKQPRPEFWPVPPVLPALDADMEDDVDADEGKEGGDEGDCGDDDAKDREEYLQHRRRYNAFHKRFTRWYLSTQVGVARAANSTSHTNPFRAWDHAKRHEMVTKWANDDTGAPEDLRIFAVALFKEKADEAKQRGVDWLDSNAVLLTWNGDFGLFSLQELGFGDGPPPTIDEVCEKLREHERLDNLRRRAVRKFERLERRFFLSDLAWAFELCCTTYTDFCEKALDRSGTPGSSTDVVPGCDVGASRPTAAESVPPPTPDTAVRVHLHAFFRANDNARIRCSKADAFKLFGSLPVKSNLANTTGGRRAPKGNQGMYYLQCPKIGMVVNGSNRAPYRDYLVSGEWVMNLLQQSKITYDNARLEIIRCAKNLPRLLHSLDTWNREHQALTLRARMRQAEASLAGCRRPFRVIPEVVKWQEQYKAELPRYQFLVLEGPSRTGKTQFSRSQSPGGNACFFEADCSSGTGEPDLRGFNPLEHDTILFDEAKIPQILKAKKLFQAGNSFVLLGASSTNCHAYSVYVWRTRLIVATNTWSAELKKATAEDREWLITNSVVVQVTEPLFLPESQ